MKTMNFRRTK